MARRNNNPPDKNRNENTMCRMCGGSGVTVQEKRDNLRDGARHLVPEMCKSCGGHGGMHGRTSS